MKQGIDYFTHNARDFDHRINADGLIDVYAHELTDLKTRLAQASTVADFPKADGIEVTETERS